jgi:large subunit ribosomal protein L22
MEVKAKARFIHMSPRKARLVTDLLKGLNVNEAVSQLKFVNKRAVGPVLKLLNSAIANATHNFNLEKNNLYIKEIRVDQGPSLKRWTPKAYGRAAPIRKRSSHISLILDETIAQKAKAGKKAPKIAAPVTYTQKPREEEMVQPVSPKIKEAAQKEAKEEVGQEIIDTRRLGKHREQQHLDRIRVKEKGGVLKRIFRRKAV